MKFSHLEENSCRRLG